MGAKDQVPLFGVKSFPKTLVNTNTPALGPSPLNTEGHKTHKSQTLTSLATDVSDDCFKHHLHP